MVKNHHGHGVLPPGGDGLHVRCGYRVGSANRAPTPPWHGRGFATPKVWDRAVCSSLGSSPISRAGRTAPRTRPPSDVSIGLDPPVPGRSADLAGPLGGPMSPLPGPAL